MAARCQTISRADRGRLQRWYESKVGPEGRRKFEKLLREVGADEEDEDVIDVESK
jgi:hypothetical protein